MQLQAAKSDKSVTSEHAQTGRDGALKWRKSADSKAATDPITGLGLRDRCIKTLDGISMLEPGDGDLWLYRVDIDNFRSINQIYGRHAGDAALRRTTKVLCESLPFGSEVWRIGDDEFAMLVRHVPGDIDLEKERDMLSAQLREPCTFGPIRFAISASLGAVKFSDTDSNGEVSLHRADLALTATKSQRPGGWTIFSPDMEDVAKARRTLIHDIELGVVERQFVPFFQPQFDAETGVAVRFEVLARWDHPRLGILTPDKFLDVAREIGALDVIDSDFFERVLILQGEWTTQLGKPVGLSFNVSADRLCHQALLDDLRDLNDAARHITLELLETIYLDDPVADIHAALADLRKTGVEIALDDFGSGRASLLAVSNVRPEHIKLDQRLIAPIVQDREARQVVQSVIKIGRDRGIASVAEGVSTQDHVEILKDMGCNCLQGFHLGRPESSLRTEALLAQGLDERN